MKIRILIKKKQGVLDIEGKAIEQALTNLGFNDIGGVIKGTFIEMDFTGNEVEVPEFVKNICEKLLVNDVIESFEYVFLK
jgi:phosphoribosylformylglycinamidine synthase